ncbi:hypothetical protein [Pseudonocardia sp.]|uniref:hypothetical protein n=1 Tax=Pseudonocardia sp. TaxID=60912 RepID=UPI002636286D|nr:hypothetical protein [Pseudonocardia sp.]
MTDLTAVAAAQSLPHVVAALHAMMPAPLALVCAGQQVAMVDSASGRTIATHGVRLPASGGADAVRIFVHHLLSDVQDLVTDHLRAPWPVADGGAALSAWTALDGATVRPGFARPGASEPALALPVFALPSPSAVRSAG